MSDQGRDQEADKSRALLAAIVTASSDAIVSKTLQGTVTSWNAAAERMFGFSASEMIGESIRKIIPPHLQHEEDMILSKITRGEALDHFETVRMTKAGRLIDISVTISPVHDGLGRVIGAAKIARDISMRKLHEEKVLLLMREVNHRAKNMLGLVQAIARHTAASSSPTEFVSRFQERIQALSANQDLLVRAEWQGVEIHDLVHAQLAPFEDLVGTRIAIQGPSLRLNAAAAQGLGLALHELTTNAGKYGSLSTEDGKIRVAWTLEAAAFQIAWDESGGPPVAQPTRKGFGTTIMTYAAETSVDGQAELVYRTEGLHWRLACAAESAIERFHPHPLSPTAPQG